MKVIFLDVDGVLITGKLGWDKPDPACVENLNNIIAATDAYIVVSSCWRIGREVIELRELLHKWSVRGRVLDRTGPTLAKRGYEIAEWAVSYRARRDNLGRYIILDDDNDMGALTRFLVRTDFKVGLTAENARVAISLLND